MSKSVSAHEFLLSLGATFGSGVIAEGTVEISDEIAAEVFEKEETD